MGLPRWGRPESRDLGAATEHMLELTQGDELDEVLVDEDGELVNEAGDRIAEDGTELVWCSSIGRLVHADEVRRR